MNITFHTLMTSESSDTVTLCISDEILTGGFLTERMNDVLTRLVLSLNSGDVEVDPTEKNLKTARDCLDRRCKLYNEKRK